MKKIQRALYLAMTPVLSLLLSGISLNAAEPISHQPEIEGPDHFDVSPPIREVNAPPSQAGNVQRPRPRIPQSANPTSGPDGALQQAPGTEVGSAPATSFGGVGDVNQVAPPDTNMAVGPNHIVQWVNLSFAVYDKKTGTILSGYPKAGNSLWKGFGGACETTNSGDPIAQYDAIADRWVMSQLAISGSTFYHCFAISQSDDPTGAYYRYSYSFSNLNDYPKVGIWPSAYFATYNMFKPIAGGLLGYSFQGAQACAYDRAAMLNGASAVKVCFQLSSSFGGLLPSDFDGGAANSPPTGSPDFFLNFGTNSLNLWKFTPNFATPSSSTFTGPTNIPVAAFSAACSGGGTCIPQSNTSQQLDSLADRLMYRLAYRNFGDHESLVVNHSVTASSNVGVRWYEIRSPNGTPTVYQQGTYAPDGNYRWMGSIAMDKAGNIGLGYSVSSSSMHPSIRYTGRQAGDALGTMTLAEQSIVEGTGSQQATLSRWGDYSAMRIDPSDDCTFWYTNEYLAADGTFNWKTQIASFKFDSCGGSATPDFAISASPSSNTVTQGGAVVYGVTITRLNGYVGDVTLTASNCPTYATCSFSTNPISGGTVSSNLNVTTAANTPVGSYTITITGTDGSGNPTHWITVTLNVNSQNPADFSISASPFSQNVSRGNSTTYTVTIKPSNSFAGSVSLNVSGLPSRSSGSFSPNPLIVSGSDGTSILAVKTNKPTSIGSYTLTITGASGSLTHSTTVTLIVQ